MPPTSSVDVFDTIKWGYAMSTTYFAFKEEDTVEMLKALDVRQMLKIWYLGDLCVLSRSGPAVLKVEALKAAGVSFNYASYNAKTSMVPAVSGQVRYGHDGTDMDSHLVPDTQLAYMYNKHLPGDARLDDTERLRITYVCCGQQSWDNRTENGLMHKMRRFLT